MATFFSDELIKTSGVLIVVLAVIYLMFDFLKSFITKMMIRKRGNTDDKNKNTCPAIREDCNNKFESVVNDIYEIKIKQGENGVRVEYLIKGQDEIKDDIKCIKNKILGA